MKNTSKFFAIIMAIIMLTSSFIMVFSNISLANDIVNDIVNEPIIAGVTYTINFGTASWNVNDTNVTAVSSDFQNLTQGPVEIGENTNIKLGNFNPETMQIKVTAEDGFKTLLSVNTEKNGNDYETKLENRPEGVNFPAETTLTFLVEAKQNNNNEGGNQGENQPQVGGPDNIEFDLTFTKTHMNVWINNKSVMDVQPADDDTKYKGTVQNAGNADETKTNELRFQANLGDYPVTEFTINGVKYNEGDEGVVIDEDGSYRITVPGATKYVITGEADENAIVPRTIIWTNPNYVPTDADDEEWIQEFKLENGYGYISAVYDENGNKLNPDTYRSENWYVNENGAGVGANGFGWIQLLPGYRAVFEFVPEYGYQLTDIRINGQQLGLSGLMNSFEFIMPNANIHFDAEFTKTDDIVKTESNKVSEGTIELAENSIDAGTVQLTVSDVELDENKLNGFKEEAGTAIVKNILDIDLYQVFYKGKNDSDDVWTNQIDELDGEAEITLKLANDVDVKNVILVHNIHDGDEYEVIEIIRYDEEAHTVTFRTKSFSNYAIAEKPEKTPEHIVLKDVESKVVIAFYDDEGIGLENFEFLATDITNLTDKQIAELGIPKTEYEKGLEKIKEGSKEYGELILLYNIQLRLPKQDRSITEGPFTIRIPYTDKLKGYENIKLAYVDEETFALKDLIELKLEDGYLVGTLPHLSPYALVGKVVENSGGTTNTGNNPSTGDNIVIFGSIFVLSALAIGFEVLVIKKSKSYR